MERRRLGRTGMDVGVLGFGGSEIGYQRASVAAVERLLGRALDAGLNVVDTAECYERSEELIGRALGARRRECWLFTKCGHPGGWGRSDWRRASLLASIERSVERLRTDHVDLIQLHSCSEDVLRRGEAIGALEQARERGLARFIGYSGDGAAARYAVECGAFDTLQTSTSVADQEPIHLTLPLAVERDMGVIAKRPIANAAWLASRRPSRGAYEYEYWKRLRALGYDFLERKDSVATALRFTLSLPGVHTAIVGTAKPGRFEDNAQALARGPLPPAAVAAVRARWAVVADRSWVGQV
ncbi:MAG: aldo/keto reductase [Candidatus Rokuibacteriota bacterium]